MPMIVITTSNSTKVNPRNLRMFERLAEKDRMSELLAKCLPNISIGQQS